MVYPIYLQNEYYYLLFTIYYLLVYYSTGRLVKERMNKYRVGVSIRNNISIHRSSLQKFRRHVLSSLFIQHLHILILTIPSTSSS